MMERGMIEVAPLAFMRGRTLNESFVILDEAQNTTTEQMKMFLTRIGLQLEGGDQRRHHPGRPAARARPSGLREAQRGARTASRGSSSSLRRARRGAPPAGAEDRRRLRPARPPPTRPRRDRGARRAGADSRSTSPASRASVGTRLAPPLLAGARSSPISRPRSDSFAVRFVGDRTMRRLNRVFRAKDRTTDVLSFPGGRSPEGSTSATSWSRCRRRRARRRRARTRSAASSASCCCTALLHCLGYDHETDDGEMSGSSAGCASGTPRCLRPVTGWLVAVALSPLLPLSALLTALLERSGPIRMRHWVQEAGGRLRASTRSRPASRSSATCSTSPPS